MGGSGTMWRWCLALLRQVGYSLCSRHQTVPCRGWCLGEESAFISIQAYRACLSTEAALRETLGCVKEQVQEGLSGGLAGKNYAHLNKDGLFVCFDGYHPSTGYHATESKRDPEFSLSEALARISQ